MSYSLGGTTWYNSSNNTIVVGGDFIANTNNAEAITDLNVSSTDNVVFNGTSEGLKLYGDGMDACHDSAPCVVSGKSTSYSSGLHFLFYYNGTLTGLINYNGSTTDYNTSSDYRLKDNIAPMTNQWDNIKSLNPSTFTFKTDASNTRVMGFIAHELANVYPSAVSGDKDAKDENGGNVYQQLDYGNLTPFITKTLQEAMLRVEILEQELAQKIERIEALESNVV